MFVLVTNDLSLSADLLAHYRNQNVVERGFRFLKDMSFAISDVFLKNVGRIEALGILMVLMLAVYSLGEYQLRPGWQNSMLTDQTSWESR